MIAPQQCTERFLASRLASGCKTHTCKRSRGYGWLWAARPSFVVIHQKNSKGCNAPISTSQGCLAESHRPNASQRCLAPQKMLPSRDYRPKAPFHLTPPQRLAIAAL